MGDRKPNEKVFNTDFGPVIAQAYISAGVDVEGRYRHLEVKPESRETTVRFYQAEGEHLTINRIAYRLDGGATYLGEDRWAEQVHLRRPDYRQGYPTDAARSKAYEIVRGLLKQYFGDLSDPIWQQAECAGQQDAIEMLERERQEALGWLNTIEAALEGQRRRYVMLQEKGAPLA